MMSKNSESAPVLEPATNKEDKCSICLPKYQKGQVIREMMASSDVYHKDCNMMEYRNHNIVPLCIDGTDPLLLASSQPSAVAVQPSAVPDQPSAVPDQPSAVPDQPSAVPHQPSAVPDQPSAVPAQVDIVLLDLNTKYDQLTELSSLVYEAIEEIGIIQNSGYGQCLAQSMAFDVVANLLNTTYERLQTECTLLISTITQLRVDCDRDDAVCTRFTAVIAQIGEACNLLSLVLARIAAGCTELSAAIVQFGAFCALDDAPCSRLSTALIRIGAVYTRLSGAIAQLYT